MASHRLRRQNTTISTLAVTHIEAQATSPPQNRPRSGSASVRTSDGSVFSKDAPGEQAHVDKPLPKLPPEDMTASFPVDDRILRLAQLNRRAVVSYVSDSSSDTSTATSKARPPVLKRKMTFVPGQIDRRAIVSCITDVSSLMTATTDLQATGMAAVAQVFMSTTERLLVWEKTLEPHMSCTTASSATTQASSIDLPSDLIPPPEHIYQLGPAITSEYSLVVGRVPEGVSSVPSDNIKDDAPANSEEIYTGPLDHRRFTLSTVASSEMLRGKDIKQRKLKFLLGKTEPVPPVPALPAPAQPRLNREEIMARRSVAVSAGLPRKRELAGLYQLIELEHKNAARPVEDYTTKPALYRIRVWCEDEAPPAYIKCFGWPFIWLVQDSELEVLWEVGSAADKMPFMFKAYEMDYLLLVRNVVGRVGWAFTSSCVPTEESARRAFPLGVRWAAV